MGDWDLNFYRRPLDPEPNFKVTKAMLRNAGIGENYWTCSIKQIPDKCTYKKALTNMVANLPKDERRGKGAIFWGKHGFGKTSAGSIVLKAAMARGGQVHSRMAGMIEHAYDKRWTETNADGVEIWDVLTNVQIVLIDDLGQEIVAAGYKAGDTGMIEELIRCRYDRRLTTYITTNLGPQDLIQHYSPICSILLEPSRFEHVEVDGHNWRKNTD